MNKSRIYLILFILGIFFSCVSEKGNKIQKELTKVEIPVFNPDSAYKYIKDQVDFGSRVPNSKAHLECGNFLTSKLSSYADSVIIQETSLKRFDGEILNIKNIIGLFSPEKNNRILLCAHWDSRYLADQDSINRDIPILGANDGGSGVGVLLEIARQINKTSPLLGIDIIFFDAEDQGEANSTTGNSNVDSWCLGSQYWTKNLHKENYFAKYGVLLDMVGGKNAKFTREGTSMYFAENIMNKVWKMAGDLGYSSYFLYEKTGQITDDHYYINLTQKIPTIDIIEYDPSTRTNFNKHWHTHQDDMNNIDKKTLKVVGETLLELIYNEK